MKLTDLHPAWQAEKKLIWPSCEQAGAKRLAWQLQSSLHGVGGIPSLHQQCRNGYTWRSMCRIMVKPQYIGGGGSGELNCSKPEMGFESQETKAKPIRRPAQTKPKQTSHICSLTAEGRKREIRYPKSNSPVHMNPMLMPPCYMKRELAELHVEGVAITRELPLTMPDLEADCWNCVSMYFGRKVR